jgi:membrane protein YdbS with pleckstrin-like domain
MDVKFENEQVEVESLPAVEELDFQSLPPSYLELSQAQNLLSMILLLGAAVLGITFTGSWGNAWVWGGTLAAWPVLMVLSVFVTRARFRRKAYALRARDINYKQGWLGRKVTTVPFNRIQHAEVSQGIIEKAWELSSVRVYTAGGRASDLTVPGLQPDEAHRIKDFLLKKIKADGSNKAETAGGEV